jgi:zinc transporter
MNRTFITDGNKAAELPFREGVGTFGTAGLLWVHINGREAEGTAWLAAQEDIPATVRTALMAQETRPRSDIVGTGALVNLRSLGLTPEDDPDALVSIRLWAEAGRVISVCFRSLRALDPVIDQFMGAEIADPGDLISAFAKAITTELDPRIAQIGDVIDGCEIGLDTSVIQSTRRKVAKMRSEAINFRRFIAPQRQALERLASAPFAWLDDDDRLHLRDAADRSARMTEELEAIRERAALMHDELTDRRAEQMESRALLISIVALIFLPLTFITGLLGMNVKGIPYADETWAFWGVVGICALLAIVVLGWFIRARWIRGR